MCRLNGEGNEMSVGFSGSSNSLVQLPSSLDSQLNLFRLLQLFASRRSLKLIKQTHCRILAHGFSQNPFLATRLVSAYGSCGWPAESRLVFDRVEDRSIQLWNALINGFAKSQVFNEAFRLFKELYRRNVSPDDFTLATLSKVAGELGDSRAGSSIHGVSLRIGFVADVVLANSLMSMYGKCGKFGDARKVFDDMPHRNSGSWNVLISGYLNVDDIEFSKDNNVWEVVKSMQINGMKLDEYTVSTLLTICVHEKTGKPDYGRELHCYVIKSKLDFECGSDVHLGCCLIDMYSKSNRVAAGKKVFYRMQSRNVYAWTAMINGLTESGNSDEAVLLFREMQVKDGIAPNKVSLVSVLPACNSLAGMLYSKEVHGYAIRKDLNHDVTLCNALINMYPKCGHLNYARRIFDGLSFRKDSVSWSSIISGYGSHGKGEEAISFYDKMLALGDKPDGITIVGMLSACNRSGLVDKGLSIYSSAINEHGIRPTKEICACVVDMLGRAGRLDQAMEFINSMPIEPGPSVWGALVSASVMHGNLQMQDLAYRFLIQLEPNNPSNYVSLSNVLASSRRWDTVSELRKEMRNRGLKKTPGCSWISIHGNRHSFFVADKAHPCSTPIYEMLDNLIMFMKGVDNPTDFTDLM